MSTRFLAVAIAAVSMLSAVGALAQNSFGEATRQQPAPQQQPQQTLPPATEPPSAAQRAATGAQLPPSTQPQTPPSVFRPGAGVGAPPQQQQAGGPGADLDRLMQVERQDFGVAPTSQLHAGQMHAPTPTSLPGGQVITTKGLVELVRGGQVPVLMLDILGGAEMIQGAVNAMPAAQSGSFNDQTQQQFGQFLQQATDGNKQYPIVLYCLSPECWMSYNAALRAINLGYTNVLWYRGGIDAWKQAGLPVQRAGQ